MKRMGLSFIAYLGANAIGLLIAILLLDGFAINAGAFIVAVLIFCAIQTLAAPLVKWVAKKQMPQLLGGISLVTIFLGLRVTEWLIAGFTIGGIANWLAATLLVWIGSLVAAVLLHWFLLKDRPATAPAPQQPPAQD